MDSSSGRVPERDPERFLVAVEACGGGTPNLSSYSMVLGYMGIYRRKKSVGEPQGAHETGGRAQGGGRALLSPGLLEASPACTPSLPNHVRCKNHAPEGFILFGLRLIFLFFKI